MKRSYFAELLTELMDVEAVMARCESLNIGDNFSLATFSLGHLDDSRNSRAAISICSQQGLGKLIHIDTLTRFGSSRRSEQSAWTSGK